MGYCVVPGWLEYLHSLRYSDKGAEGSVHVVIPVLSWDGQSILGLMPCSGTTHIRIPMPFDGITGHPSLSLQQYPPTNLTALLLKEALDKA